MARRRATDELQEAPGIGPSLARDLHELGVHTLGSLARRDPERLYERLSALRSQRQDPCVLYAFRCAVYYARTERPKAELLKWWNWKGRTLAIVVLLCPAVTPACGSLWESECEYSTPTPPTLTAFAILPDTVDVTTASRQVTASVTASSEQSNVLWSCCWTTTTSPSGNTTSLPDRVALGAEPGRWDLQTTASWSGSFPHCAGDYSATRSWSSADLRFMGFDDHFTVINRAWAACRAGEPQLIDFAVTPALLDVTSALDTLNIRMDWVPFTPASTVTVTGGPYDGGCSGSRCSTGNSLLIFRQGFAEGTYAVSSVVAAWVTDSNLPCRLSLDPFATLAESAGWPYRFAIANRSN